MRTASKIDGLSALRMRPFRAVVGSNLVWSSLLYPLFLLPVENNGTFIL